MSLPDFSDAELIDNEQFEMLVATGEDEAAEMLAELLELYTGEAEPKFVELYQAAGEVDRHKCNRIGHALAGASANLGLLRLSKLCRAYENGAKADWSKEDLEDGAKAIESLYHESVVEMKNRIAAL